MKKSFLRDLSVLGRGSVPSAAGPKAKWSERVEGEMDRRYLRFPVRGSVHHARLGPKGKVRVRSAELRSEGTFGHPRFGFGSSSAVFGSHGASDSFASDKVPAPKKGSAP